MESMNYTTPGIASILETLRAYTPAGPQAQTRYAPGNDTHGFSPPLQSESRGDEDLEEGEFDPMDYNPSQPLTITPHPQPTPQLLPFITKPDLQTPPQQQHQPAPVQQSPQSAPKNTYQPPTYPPSTITTWPPALRHITSLSATNPEFTFRIHHLIKIQHDHERQWHSSRLALIQKLSTRESSRTKLDSVLGSLGGNVKKRRHEDEKTLGFELVAELALFDRKVYKACLEMEAACGRELQMLEVPFFCTMRGLVTGKEVEKKVGRKKGTIREEELVELRRRMVQLLEDLCGGEE